VGVSKGGVQRGHSRSLKQVLTSVFLMLPVVALSLLATLAPSSHSTLAAVAVGVGACHAGALSTGAHVMVRLMAITSV
jgi:hypothetical protein